MGYVERQQSVENSESRFMSDARIVLPYWGFSSCFSLQLLSLMLNFPAVQGVCTRLRFKDQLMELGLVMLIFRAKVTSRQHFKAS